MQSSERKKKGAQSDGAFAVSVKSVIIAALSFYITVTSNVFLFSVLWLIPLHHSYSEK